MFHLCFEMQACIYLLEKLLIKILCRFLLFLKF